MEERYKYSTCLGNCAKRIDSIVQEGGKVQVQHTPWKLRKHVDSIVQEGEKIQV